MINFKSMLICAFFGSPNTNVFQTVNRTASRISLWTSVQSLQSMSFHHDWVTLILDWRPVFSYNNSILPWKSFLEQLNLLSQSQSESLPHEFNYIPQWWRHCDPELYALMRKSLELLWNAIFVVLVSDCANNCKMSQMLQICDSGAQKQS